MAKVSEQKMVKYPKLAIAESTWDGKLNPGQQVYTRCCDDKTLNRRFGWVIKNCNKSTQLYIVKLVLTHFSPYYMHCLEWLYHNMPLLYHYCINHCNMPIYDNLPSLKEEIIVSLPRKNLRKVNLVPIDGTKYEQDDFVGRGVNQIEKDRCHYCMRKDRKLKKGQKMKEITMDNGKIKKLQKCAKCFQSEVRDKYIVRYCSKECQKLDWYQHKLYCGVQYTHYCNIEECD